MVLWIIVTTKTIVSCKSWTIWISSTFWFYTPTRLITINSYKWATQYHKINSSHSHKVKEFSLVKSTLVEHITLIKWRFNSRATSRYDKQSVTHLWRVVTTHGISHHQGKWPRSIGRIILSMSDYTMIFKTHVFIASSVIGGHLVNTISRRSHSDHHCVTIP